MICPSCSTVLRVHDIRPYYTCPRCLGQVFDPRYVPDSETDAGPDMSLIEACANHLSELRAQAFSNGVAKTVGVCLHETIFDSPDDVQDTMRSYQDPLRMLGVPSEIVSTDFGSALCGAGKPDAALGLLARLSPDVERSALQDAMAARPAKEWFLAAAIRRRLDAVETVIAHVRYGGGVCQLVACLRSG